MMDEFYRLKPGETVENALRYNSAAVVLSDLGSDFNMTAGDVKTVRFSISNYDDVAPSAKLEVSLTDAQGNAVFSDTLNVGDVANGKLASLGKVEIPVPQSVAVKKYMLKVAFTGGNVKASNEWQTFSRSGMQPLSIW